MDRKQSSDEHKAEDKGVVDVTINSMEHDKATGELQVDISVGKRSPVLSFLDVSEESEVNKRAKKRKVIHLSSSSEDDSSDDDDDEPSPPLLLPSLLCSII